MAGTFGAWHLRSAAPVGGETCTEAADGADTTGTGTGPDEAGAFAARLMPWQLCPRLGLEQSKEPEQSSESFRGSPILGCLLQQVQGMAQHGILQVQIKRGDFTSVPLTLFPPVGTSASSCESCLQGSFLWVFLSPYGP